MALSKEQLQIKRKITQKQNELKEKQTSNWKKYLTFSFGNNKEKQEEKEPQAMSFPTWKSWLRTSPISSIPTKTIRASNVTTIHPESKDRATNRMHL